MNWDVANLKSLLIAHQNEYNTKGIDHGRYPEPDEVFYSTWINHRTIIASLIPKECRKPQTRVIDVGGGKGRMSVLLTELGLDCTIIDCIFQEENDALTTAGQPFIPLVKSYLETKGVKIVNRDFYQDGFPFPNESFDLAILSEVIEHLPNSPKPVLAEIKRILAPQGWLILTTPNLVSITKRGLSLIGRSYRENIQAFYRMEGSPAGSIYRGHNREYTRPEVEYMLRQEGFVIVKSMTCDYFRPSVWGTMRDLGMKSLALTALHPLKRFSPNLRGFVVVLARK